MSPLSDTAATLGSLRRILLGILLLGMAGSTIELLLLQHTEDSTQLIPLLLMGIGYIVVAWNAVRKSRRSITSLQILMVLFIAAGVLGTFFHYQANVAFQLEVEPQLAGRELVWKVLRAQTPPALAPGVLAQLGLVGLAYAYRHPALTRNSNNIEENRNDE